MIVILPPVLIFGRHLISLFTETEEVIRMGYNYLLLQGFTFYSYIILFQSNALLQGLKKPAMIMWMGLYRQILAPAGVFYLLCFTFGMARMICSVSPMSTGANETAAETMNAISSGSPSRQ